MPISVDAASMLTKALSDKDAGIDLLEQITPPRGYAHYREAGKMRQVEIIRSANCLTWIFFDWL